MQESSEAGLAEQPTKMAMIARSNTLLLVNVIGAFVYDLAASAGWREDGVDSITGEPFVWFAGILPVITIFFVINCVWGGFIVARRHWKAGVFWLLAVAAWLVAVIIDFAHH